MERWVFRLSGSGAFDSERSASERSYEFGLSADRTTDRWKLIVSSRGTRRNKTFLVRGQTVRNLTTSTRLSGLLVKSMNPHWGAAMQAAVSGSSVSNVRRLVSAAPGIEYNLFPYNQFARRALTFRYTVGVDAYNYRELTIFDRLRETVPNHRFVASLAVREPWGWVGASATTTQHLNARGRYRATLFTGAEILLFSGVALSVSAEYEAVRDQISLEKGAATTEEILLRSQQLPMDSNYFLSFGFSYTFGSIFNSAVNSRFNGATGF